MAVRIFLTQCLVGLLVSSGAFAGITTGPAAGTNVEPSTAIHKPNSGGSGVEGGAIAAGSPGVEAKPGTEGGEAPGGRSGAGGGEIPKPKN
jgi:hypothetical protein